MTLMLLTGMSESYLLYINYYIYFIVDAYIYFINTNIDIFFVELLYLVGHILYIYSIEKYIIRYVIDCMSFCLLFSVSVFLFSPFSFCIFLNHRLILIQVS